MHHTSTHKVKTAAASDMTQLQKDYYSWLGKFLLGAGAAGAAVRGTTGLAEILAMNMKGRPVTPDPLMINIPYRPKPDEENAPTSMKYGAASAGSDKSFMQYFMQGPPGARSFWDIPAAWPLTALGGAAAGMGGYGLVNKLMERYKAKRTEEDLEDARSEYEESLLQQFKPIPQAKVRQVSIDQKPTKTKTASEFNEDVIKTLIDKTASTDARLNEIADKLDELATKVLEKKANWIDDAASTAYNYTLKPLGNMIDWPTNWSRDNTAGYLMSRGTGLYGVLAPILAGASGLAMYNYAKNNDPDAAVADALRKQHEERWKKRPSDVFARLVPVDEKGKPVRDLRRLSLDENESKTASDQKIDEINAKAAAFVKEILGD